MLNTIFHTHDSNHRSIHPHNQNFYRSASMFPPIHTDRNPAQFSRLLSGDSFMTFPNSFQQLRINNEDDGDDEADDYGEEEETPTVEHPPPKFSK